MNQETLQENKMGTMPINRLLISMALPMIISMLVQALYNIVDSIFVAKLSEDALTAVSLAFPMQNFMIAVGGGLGVGMNALLSKKLGEKDVKSANKAGMNGLFLGVLAFALFALIGVFGVRLFFTAQTDIAHIVEDGVSYLRICCVLSFGLFTQMLFERLLQSTGKTFYTMITQGTGAIINIILDPIMIFGLLGFPKMGVAGAALATVIGQMIAGVLAIYFNKKKNTEISLNIKGFRPEFPIIRRVLSVGIPSIIMASIGSVMTFGLNKILMAFSSTATAVFGVYFKLQSFVFMPVFGLNNGMVPIVAYNYGARDKKRMMQTMKLSVVYAVSIMLLGFAAFQLVPGGLLALFDASENMLAIGVPALRIISINFIFAGFCIICSSVFQALGNGVLSMLMSIVRQLVVLLPVAYFLSLTGVLDVVWLSFPISEVISTILCIFFLKYVYTKEIKPLEFLPKNMGNSDEKKGENGVTGKTISDTI